MGSNKINWIVGEVIYKLGEEAQYAYLLTDGEVEIISKNGTKVGFINKNEVFGEQSIILNTKRTVTAIARLKSTAVAIPKINLINDYKSSPFLIQAVLRSTYVRLTNLSSTLKDGTNTPTHSRRSGIGNRR